ncbi:hypothetical protein BDB00DRAFT_865610 [Zychaea mexicana]|uniref:uncharacterized protein n=1 Tax=Zychaea mexicana TaxID=64656 RepID=UPI0022FEC029|nr:uncharacterized protein BDB00DRAFT_865610 [Zychaea mexicana]KAI9466481.1 hypothetical protein BDB00DRAFT_865610 [Zychaea mexicana]
MLCMFHHADVPSDTVAAYFGKKCQCTHPASTSNTGTFRMPTCSMSKEEKKDATEQLN